ncbi:peptidoglycan-binding protein [Vibrio ziniensis]|nr:peptidoglycan-binding protein [Vibrio ziniensis]QIH43465.1 hypothetical protein G5S32_15825 [Vibrio ziniensis]
MHFTISNAAFAHRVNAVFYCGNITNLQVNGCARYLVAWLLLRSCGHRIPLSYVAYVLATVYHETAFAMQPVEEYGKGVGYQYGIPDSETGKAYYGRGDVQVTWKANYQKLSEMVINPVTLKRGVDLVKKPEWLLRPMYSAQATILGMGTGLFTGKRLADYLDQEQPDYISARRIINGTDRAETIAGYAHDFERALKLALGAPINRSTLKVGSRGVDVIELQLNLSLKPDGIFGNVTQSKIIEFQKQHSLSPDGVVGKNTWDKIESTYYWS